MYKNIQKLFLLLLCIPMLVSAQEWKELKDLKACVKTSNIGKGRELIAKCMKDTAIVCEPELFSLAIALEKKANDAENMKLYTKQRYDTVGFFNSVSNIVDYTIQMEQVLKTRNPKAAQKSIKKRAELLKPYYPNLYRGGVFFIKNKRWDDADRAFSLYINVAQLEKTNTTQSIMSDRLSRSAFWSMTACFESKRYADVFKYQNLAESDSANIDYVLQYEALAYEHLNDTINYIATLKRGLSQLTQSDYFFSRLTDYLNNTKQYHAACQLNDSLLSIRPGNPLYLFAQSVALFNLNAYDKCIENTEQLLQIDKENIAANYYIGLCWYNKGIGYESTLSPNPTSLDYKIRKNEVNEMFRKAMPYLEKYRQAYPNDQDKWKTSLYKIYFNLNLSEKLRDLEN